MRYQRVPTKTPVLFRVGMWLRTILLTLVITISGVPVSALSEADYSTNNIFVYQKGGNASCSSANSGSRVSGNDNVAKIWNYFISKGLNDQQAAGILGNIQEESGFSPFRQETTYINDFSKGGYGIVQWTAERRVTIVNALTSKYPDIMAKYFNKQYGGAASKANGYVPEGISVEDNDKILAVELDFLYQESTTRTVRSGYGVNGKSEWESISAATSIKGASDVWMYSFERPADQSPAHAQQRADNGQKIYDELKGTTPSASTGTPASGNSTISAGDKGTILIDPGHGAAIPEYIDTATGLHATETANQPEGDDVLDVSKRVKTGLEAAGYTVILARTDNTTQVTFRQRADAAKSAGAVMGISIHTAPDNINDAWPQRVGSYREYQGKRTTFENQTTAQKSQAYAAAFAETRAAAEGHPISNDPDSSHELASFGRSGILSKGNIPLVELFADTVPWVYNEIEQDSGTSITEDRKAAYAKGIIDGVIKANPSGGPATRSTGGCSAGSSITPGDLSAATLAYAWPDYHPAPYTTRKPEYAAAADKAQKMGMYIGATVEYCAAKGKVVDGVDVDCGGFVTRLVIDSGWDTSYNYSGKLADGAGPTDAQKTWLDAHWQNLGNASSIDTATLMPGDVAISGGHTFIYVGTISGFNSKIASASLCERAPMAGRESLTNGDFTWYRKR